VERKLTAILCADRMIIDDGSLAANKVAREFAIWHVRLVAFA